MTQLFFFMLGATSASWLPYFVQLVNAILLYLTDKVELAFEPLEEDELDELPKSYFAEIEETDED